MKFGNYILVALGALFVYYICLNLGGLILSSMSDWVSIFHGFYFSVLLLVCTAVIVGEIRRKKE